MGADTDALYNEYRAGVRAKKERAFDRGKIKKDDVVDDDDSMVTNADGTAKNAAANIFEAHTGRRKAGKVKVIEEAKKMRAAQNHAVMYSTMTLEEVYKAEVPATVAALQPCHSASGVVKETLL